MYLKHGPSTSLAFDATKYSGLSLENFTLSFNFCI